MKKLIIGMMAVLMLATGCTKEVKESKSESKKATHVTEKIQKNQSEDAYNPLSDGELTYMKTIQKALESFTEKTTDVGKLMQQANANPSVSHDKEWMDSLKGDFMTIAVMGRLLNQMSDDGVVPDRFLNLHSNMKETFGRMSEAGGLLVNSIENNLNMNMFNESMRIMAISNQKLIEVTNELKEINIEVNAN